MTTTRITLLGAGAWAAAMIASAFLFKGEPLGDWIEGALLVGFKVFISHRAGRMAQASRMARGADRRDRNPR
jgi:hypothetical protein